MWGLFLLHPQSSDMLGKVIGYVSCIYDCFLAHYAQTKMPLFDLFDIGEKQNNFCYQRSPFSIWEFTHNVYISAQKMKKSLMEKFIFCAVESIKTSQLIVRNLWSNRTNLHKNHQINEIEMYGIAFLQYGIFEGGFLYQEESVETVINISREQVATVVNFQSKSKAQSVFVVR